MTDQVIRTRMAPSPTGEMHIGGLRTLLFSYAFAKKHDGQFVLRIEDTDKKREVPGAVDRILQVIRKYGLSWDEGPQTGGPYGPYIQSQRLEIYNKYIKELLDKKLAYYCFCTPERLSDMRQKQQAAGQIPKYDRHCLDLSDSEIQKNLSARKPCVIRLRVPDNETVSFNDAVRGEIKISTREIDDQVLIKSDGIPTYHFAVVVDDHLMKISHVIRGDEWISSAPKQILLYKYFGWEIPVFAHLPVFLDPGGQGKMSKRHGTVSAQSFLDEGYLPQAMLNFLMLLGWNPGTDQEIFSLTEFIKEFSLERLHKKQPVFDRKKLDYLNAHYIREMSDKELVNLLTPFVPDLDKATLLQLVPLLRERITRLTDAFGLTRFLVDSLNYEKILLLQRGTDETAAVSMLLKVKNLLNQTQDWSPGNLQPLLMKLIGDNNWNTGQFFMVFRVAVCGSPITLPVVECLPILGRDKTIAHIDLAIKKLQDKL
ncbi:MAG: glutamate--tRNA ligase [Patescibacteria group bacterium]